MRFMGVYKPYRLRSPTIPYKNRRIKSIPEKIDDVILDYKKKGDTYVISRDIAKSLNIMPNRVGALLRQSKCVEYDREKNCWVIL